MSTKTSKTAVVDITIRQGEYFKRLKLQNLAVVDTTIQGKKYFKRLNYKLHFVSRYIKILYGLFQVTTKKLRSRQK